MTDPELDRLLRAAEAPGARILLRGGTVLSMDAGVGDLELGDVLIEGRHITAIAPELPEARDAAGTVVVDARGKIVMPGMHDTHRHCWQGQLRRLIAGADLDEYLATVHTGIGPVYRPEDIYAGNLIAALGALDSGVTTVCDFSHNSRSAAHSDAAIRAFVDAGVRTVHASGPPLVGAWDEQWPQDLARLQEEVTDPLVTFRLAVYGPLTLGGPEIALTPATLARARQLGVGIIADAVSGPDVSRQLVELGQAGLLGPDVTLIHCSALSGEAWRHIADAGVSVSLCSTSDPQIGCGDAIPAIQQALDHDVRPGLSVDVECCLSTSLFAQMQATYTVQRMMALHRRIAGEADAPAPLGVHDTLRMATSYGAAVNGLADRVGALRPGAEADVVLIDAEHWNTTPLNHAAGTVVLGADTRNVDAVFVAGRVRKWRGAIVGHVLAEVRELVTASRDRVLTASGFPLDVVRREPATAGRGA